MMVTEIKFLNKNPVKVCGDGLFPPAVENLAANRRGAQGVGGRPRLQ